MAATVAMPMNGSRSNQRAGPTAVMAAGAATFPSSPRPDSHAAGYGVQAAVQDHPRHARQGLQQDRQKRRRHCHRGSGGHVVYHEETGELIADCIEPGVPILIAKGGRGGRGNRALASAKDRNPEKVEEGNRGRKRSCGSCSKCLRT